MKYRAVGECTASGLKEGSTHKRLSQGGWSGAGEHRSPGVLWVSEAGNGDGQPASARGDGRANSWTVDEEKIHHS